MDDQDADVRKSLALDILAPSLKYELSIFIDQRPCLFY